MKSPLHHSSFFLPTFSPTAPGIVLFLNRDKPRERGSKVFLVNASQVFEKGDPSRAERDRLPKAARRVNAGAFINNFIPDAGIQRIADTLIGWKEEEKLSRIVDHAALLHPSAFILHPSIVSPSRYIHTSDAETYRPIAEIVETALRIGKRIQTEILGNQRAEYGDEIVATLSRQLVEEFGSGFSEKSLRRMVQFAAVFSEAEIVATLSRQLSWSHFKEIIPLKDDLQRDFYAEMCRVERWSVRTLRKKIDSMLYERTAISKKPEEVAKAELAALRSEDQLTPDLVFRDPYILDFLGLKDRYLEKDLEDAILRELETFLLELGNGFAFLGRQTRIQIDSDDFYLDLLFYHRGLRRLIAIDLKLADFKAEYKGQMELYLRWLAKHEQQPGEDSPLGIILCAGKKTEQIELLELDQSGIHVAEYLTALPPRELLQQKLHAAIEISRTRLESEAVNNPALVWKSRTTAADDSKRKGGKS